MKTLWLVADDPDGTWWCKCRQGIVDAPWHDKETFPADGNGWLWTCVKCHRAVMFARAAFIGQTLESLARQQTPRVQKCISADGSVSVRTLLARPEEWLAIAEPLARQIREGERYVFFDGHILPAKSGPVKFTGLVRSHDLPELPHLSEPLGEQTLFNPDYWFAK
jgi:hypothetical protein